MKIIAFYTLTDSDGRNAEESTEVETCLAYATFASVAALKGCSSLGLRLQREGVAERYVECKAPINKHIVTLQWETLRRYTCDCGVEPVPSFTRPKKHTASCSRIGASE